jgi:hypothetical protein
MVELQIVVLAVAGSSPVGHPTFLQGKCLANSDKYKFCEP